ncbi:tRNA uridine-5-carboxymethylaminomethyl(34) synthesis GTPase MnmE [Croceicoccus gelatinilyticus]|uniref:tRNA uridine-5-carboxymethylaminomethyl(34) synthesis GTPase MnmE n=1 Tax=Croceicoccus gelatinilyticus TaxID=2835536 RepID=UPI001BCFB7FC|nr:tRNA uridine-5-carboxymethylaminomethyl(34) synthesis GTPase MnmE [Croceicoccus gelatinilyticus]MBS7669830.1 tRNA uridine-5-carboxymethylaminomethyl(34) synthesis GTPase MnmE [Croceicoccus gelatinilyticus]
MGGDTIFALSSGSPPAAIAVIRLSGPGCSLALETLTGSVPEARKAFLRSLRDPLEGALLDRALVLFMPGPASATGEDCAELHLHGGRAIISAVERALSNITGLRHAEPGEFTRRAFANGRMDVSEAEGLADLLSAETELQRRNAQALAGGVLSRQVSEWRDSVLSLAAEIESNLDFSDEDDVAELSPVFAQSCDALASSLATWLEAPRAEVLKEGYRVVIGGPPNSGKSSLFNALLEEEAAIATPIAGTTRDVLSRSVGLGGVPFTFTDTAGLRSATDDEIEQIGIERARGEIERADLVLWLGPEGEGPQGAWEVETMIDRAEHVTKSAPRHRISSTTLEGVSQLVEDLVSHAKGAMPKPGQVALARHQRTLLADARDAIDLAGRETDMLIAAEHLRRARLAFDRLTGRAATEDMLDTLFGRFCIGK